MAHWTPHGRIDAHVLAAAEYLQTRQPYFEVKEVIALVRSGVPGTRLRGLGGVLQMINRAAKDWELEEAVLDYVEKRAKAYLHQTVGYRFKPKNEKVEVRVFEHYEDAQGRHRWQPIKAMTADELELCVVQRRKRMRGEEIRIDVYEALITQLRQLPAGATVAQVEQQVLAANP